MQYKTWAPNSGRVSTGESVGDIQRVTWKLALKWSMLTKAEKQLCDSLFNVVSPAYFPVTFNDDGTTRSITCYAGDFTYSKKIVCGNGEVYYQGCAVSLIQK